MFYLNKGAQFTLNNKNNSVQDFCTICLELEESREQCYLKQKSSIWGKRAVKARNGKGNEVYYFHF